MNIHFACELTVVICVETVLVQFLTWWILWPCFLIVQLMKMRMMTIPISASRNQTWWSFRSLNNCNVKKLHLFIYLAALVPVVLHGCSGAVCRLSCPTACGILVSRLGIELTSLALEGGPPGTPYLCYFTDYWHNICNWFRVVSQKGHASQYAENNLRLGMVEKGFPGGSRQPTPVFLPGESYG